MIRLPRHWAVILVSFAAGFLSFWIGSWLAWFALAAPDLDIAHMAAENLARKAVYVSIESPYLGCRRKAHDIAMQLGSYRLALPRQSAAEATARIREMAEIERRLDACMDGPDPADSDGLDAGSIGLEEEDDL